MKVILKEKVANLGNVGDVVNVKPGYGRNYLIPKSMAVTATQSNLIEFEKQRAELEKKAQQNLALAQERAEKLADLTITLEVQAGDEGKLFGSIGPRDIAEAVTDAGVELMKKEVSMPEGPIRQVGEYDITVNLHSEVAATIKVILQQQKTH